MDNSNTKKVGVSRTYHNNDGYAPIAAYLGLEGWCLEVELRPGSQHSQEEFIPYLNRVIDRARSLTSKKLLVSALIRLMMHWKQEWPYATGKRSISSSGIRAGKTAL